MTQCTSCGMEQSDHSRTCSRCGIALATSNGHASDETVAYVPENITPKPFSESSRPRSTSSASRISAISVVDEGRFPPGTLVAGRYRIVGMLGRGGMGEVYRATDLTLGQSVALKFLPADAAADERVLERFHSEVRIARQVSHPNVCRVYDIGEAEGLPFISMEYIDGEDLSSLLQRIGRLSPDKALEMTRKLCAGLAAAHERGVIHRDLKPQNIMLNKRGEVVITDFGLAAVADSLHGAEVRNGTPAYMSPEQLRGDSVSARSDLYALGLIAYELFTGRRAFEGNSFAELLKVEEIGKPATISSIVSDVDPLVDKVILRCLRPDPAERPASALMVAAALPGGDPLAAALAAGETPSPELVAASGSQRGFALRYAVPSLVFVLLGLLLFPFIMQPISMLAVTSVEYPAAVLQQKAREMTASFGYVKKPIDWKSWFRHRGAMVSYLKEHAPKPIDWKKLYAIEPPVLFDYRDSPIYLRAPPDGDVTFERPSMNAGGMTGLSLDSRGLLRGFSHVAPSSDKSAASDAPAFDPAAVFHQAGLDIANFQETAPEYSPPLAFDARRAWKGAFPGLPNVNISVEIATWRGRLTSFYIRWPWSETYEDAEKPMSTGAFLRNLFSLMFLVVGIFFAILMARNNLRLGRGDRQGAYRLAGVAFLLFAVTDLASMHVIPKFDMAGVLFVGFAFGAALCGLLWMAYIALEPAVRARWPHSLITWNRLLAGKIGDPRLGSHILLGVVFGLVIRYFFVWRLHWGVVQGGPPDESDLSILLGINSVINRVANTAFSALMTGTIIFWLLCGLRALLRRDWLAAIAAALLFALQQGSVLNSANLFIDVPVFIFIFVVLCYALLRMGFVPGIVAIFVIDALGLLPIGSEFGAWYNPITFSVLALVGGMAIFGFWRSQSYETA